MEMPLTIKPTVYGVGYYSEGKYAPTLNGKITREYDMWRCMLKRCYNENDLKRYPKYRGCYVVPDFLDFQLFMKWAEVQTGFKEEDGCKTIFCCQARVT